jgi:hypothetical protein
MPEERSHSLERVECCKYHSTLLRVGQRIKLGPCVQGVHITGDVVPITANNTVWPKMITGALDGIAARILCFHGSFVPLKIFRSWRLRGPACSE